MERNRSTWERLGRDDPLWAIMPYPADKSADWNLDEFMATGVADIDVVAKQLAELSLTLHGRVLDFGCGVGRLSNAIAEQPEVTSVVGVDIAASMVQQARAHCRHPERVSFEHYDGRMLPFDDDAFDCAVSLVVVQHAPPQSQLRYLAELNRVVAGDGVLVLQVVTEPRLPQPLPQSAARAAYEVLAAPASLRPGEAAELRVRVRNDGDQHWPAGVQLRLADHWHRDGRMTVRDDGRTELPALAPGQSAELPLTVTAPRAQGVHQLELDVVQELVAWWSDLGSQTLRVDVRVDGEPVPPPAEPPDATRGVEMHAVPDALLRAMFGHCGSTVLGRAEDHYSDGHWDSHTYVIRVGR